MARLRQSRRRRWKAIEPGLKGDLLSLRFVHLREFDALFGGPVQKFDGDGDCLFGPEESALGDFVRLVHPALGASGCRAGESRDYVATPRTTCSSSSGGSPGKAWSGT